VVHESRLRSYVHASPMGNWRISLWQTDPRLAGLVAAMWFGEGRVTYQRDRILPSGQSQLLINLGPPQYRIEHGPPERHVPFKDVWYSGLHQMPVDTEAPHGNALLGVAFTAAGTYPWLGESMEALSDCIVPLADAVGDGVLLLRERLLNERTAQARFSLLERWLIARLSPRKTSHPVVPWATERLAVSHGRISMQALAARSGFTRRYLARLFREQVGLTPKALARIHRFRHAFDSLRSAAPGSIPWTTLAETGGYYDQSHLVNEFRQFTGFTPVQLAHRERPDAQSIVLA
jgi:AraC-like DNA-binding protein